MANQGVPEKSSFGGGIGKFESNFHNTAISGPTQLSLWLRCVDTKAERKRICATIMIVSLRRRKWGPFSLARSLSGIWVRFTYEWAYIPRRWEEDWSNDNNKGPSKNRFWRNSAIARQGRRKKRTVGLFCLCFLKPPFPVQQFQSDKSRRKLWALKIQFFCFSPLLSRQGFFNELRYAGLQSRSLLWQWDLAFFCGISITIKMSGNWYHVLMKHSQTRQCKIYEV